MQISNSIRRSVTSQQTQAFLNVVKEDLNLSRLKPVDSPGAGRGQKVLSILIDTFERKHCKHDKSFEPVLNTAMPADPERMSLPTKAASVNPEVIPQPNGFG